LLAPSLHGLKRMLHIANTYSVEYNIKFNPDKSKMVIYDKDTTVDVSVMFNDCILRNNDKDVHLGNNTGPGVESNGIREIISDFYRRVNITLARFSKVKPNIKYELLKSYCMCLYGCQLWDYSSPDIELFFTAWRKCIRRVWSLPQRTRCHLLHLICQDKSVEMQLHKRFLNFFSKIILSHNDSVRLMGKMVIGGSRSATSNSVNCLCHKYLNLNKYNDFLHGTQMAELLKSPFVENPPLREIRKGMIKQQKKPLLLHLIQHLHKHLK
jgi:hypothetical protein